MLFSRLFFHRINFSRLKSTLKKANEQIDLVAQLNQIQSKDLTNILNEEQTKSFLKLKHSLGGKFHSIQQLQNQRNLHIDFDKFFGYLLAMNTRKKETDHHRIHIEPRLTSKTVADIETVCSLDYTSSYINWTIVKTTDDKKQFQVKQWNSVEIDLDRKFHFIKTFNKLSDGLSTIPLNDANALLVEQVTYRYPNIQLVPYLAQLQQIRAVFNTLLHSQSVSPRPVYHISGRDVASRFGLFVGNEQSSAEFFLTNLIFNNTTNDQMVFLEMDHQLKTNYHRAVKGQKEPMAQCLLRALAFLQCVNDKKYPSLSH